jgi:hypothetical protein
MSDPYDAAFTVLRGQTPPRPFAPAEAVRRRGHQRAFRQTVVAGAVVFAVAAAGAGWAAVRLPHGPGRQQPAATTSPSVQPSVAPESPAPTGTGAIGTAPPPPAPSDLTALLLRPADLGPGNWQATGGAEPFEGPDEWAWAFTDCPAYRSADYPSLRQILKVTFDGYHDGQRYMTQQVHRYAPGWGTRALDDVRHVLATCPGPTAPPSPDGSATSHYAVVDTGFAGDQALLVQEDINTYGTDKKLKTDTSFAAVVRVGDLVTTVWASSNVSRDAVRALAVKAADRLRSG